MGCNESTPPLVLSSQPILRGAPSAREVSSNDSSSLHRSTTPLLHYSGNPLLYHFIENHAMAQATVAHDDSIEAVYLHESFQKHGAGKDDIRARRVEAG